MAFSSRCAGNSSWGWMFQFFRRRGLSCAPAVKSSSSCLFIIFIFDFSLPSRSVDFSQGQGGQGFVRRRSIATPHKQNPRSNAEIAEKRHSLPVHEGYLVPV